MAALSRAAAAAAGGGGHCLNDAKLLLAPSSPSAVGVGDGALGSVRKGPANSGAVSRTTRLRTCRQSATRRGSLAVHGIHIGGGFGEREEEGLALPTLRRQKKELCCIKAMSSLID